MFYNCRKLKELNISVFNIENVSDRSLMFNKISKELKNKIKISENKKINFIKFKRDDIKGVICSMDAHH